MIRYAISNIALTAIINAAERAVEQIDHCDCKNGVTTPMGDVDEGDVWAVRTIDQLREAVRIVKKEIEECS